MVREESSGLQQKREQTTNGVLPYFLLAFAVCLLYLRLGFCLQTDLRSRVNSTEATGRSRAWSRPTMHSIASRRSERLDQSPKGGGWRHRDRPYHAHGRARTGTEAVSDLPYGRCTATLSCAFAQSFPGNEQVIDPAYPNAPRSKGTSERKRQTGYLDSQPGR